MTTITVTNAAQLTSALSVAHAGDTISLAAGNYGDFAISGKSFTTDVTISSQSATAPATFHSLSITGSTHIHVDDVAVNFTPTMTTLAWSPAVKIDGSNSISFTHSTVTGGNAINGVLPTATALDTANGNVVGFPTGYGVNVTGSSKIVIDSDQISHVGKGVVLNNVDQLAISHNDIHDLRQTGITGAGLSNTTIDSNHVHDSNPWRWGDTANNGDHADFLALWTSTTQPVASSNITITNNLMEQGKGTAVLGMWLQGDATPFTNVTISNNAFLDGNLQGIMLRGVNNSTVDHNTLLQTSGDSKAAPGILLTSNVHNVAVSSNITGVFSDTSGSTGTLANTAVGNQVVQDLNPNLAGFYNTDMITSIEQAYASHTSIFTTASADLTGGFLAKSIAEALAVETTSLTTASVGMVVNGTYAADRLLGGGGDDTINQVGGTDTLIGGAGNDTYYVNNTTTQIVEQVGGGTDTVVAKGDYTLQANVENLVVNNTVANNWAGTGNALNNVITGSDGANRLDGGAGNDTINGGLGADTVIGGLGDDRLTGGAGKDTFKFELSSGHDVVTDFNKVDHDVLDISTYLKAGLHPILHDVGTDVTLSFSTGDTITLTGVHAANLIATSSGFTI